MEWRTYGDLGRANVNLQDQNDKEASFWQNRYNFMLFDKNWSPICFFDKNFIL